MMSAKRRKALRAAITVVLIVAAVIVLWTWVFPWVDRTFVNRPEVGSLGLLL